jgi:hypothetical protein
VIAELLHRDIDAAAVTGVRNSQPEGIGRVVNLGDLVCWNNLGRNVVFADAADAGLRPRAVFGRTLFPGEDEPSQYDLDVHAILGLPECGLVAVLNHFGVVRGFRRAELLGHTGGQLAAPSSSWSFVADVERTIAVAGRLVGSAPRSDGAIGLLVSDLVETIAPGATLPTRLGATAFGEVTALGVVPSEDGPLVAVGGDARVALVPLAEGQLGRPRWEAGLGFRVAITAWHDGLLWAAGPDRADEVDDYDWERLKGGGFAALDPADGRSIMGGPLPADVAWGTGGVAVAPFGSWLAVAGRTGCMYLVDPRTGACHRSAGYPSAGHPAAGYPSAGHPAAGDAPAGQPAASSPAGPSLGIAHLAVVGKRVLCGFNRGGYRLHSFEEAAARDSPYSLRGS